MLSLGFRVLTTTTLVEKVSTVITVKEGVTDAANFEEVVVTVSTMVVLKGGDDVYHTPL